MWKLLFFLRATNITTQGSREKGLIEPSKSGVGFDYNLFRLGDFASFSLDGYWKIATTPSVSQVIAFFRRATLRCNIRMGQYWDATTTTPCPDCFCQSPFIS